MQRSINKSASFFFELVGRSTHTERLSDRVRPCPTVTTTFLTLYREFLRVAPDCETLSEEDQVAVACIDSHSWSPPTGPSNTRLAVRPTEPLLWRPGSVLFVRIRKSKVAAASTGRPGERTTARSTALDTLGDVQHTAATSLAEWRRRARRTVQSNRTPLQIPVREA